MFGIISLPRVQLQIALDLTQKLTYIFLAPAVTVGETEGAMESAS